MTRSRKTLTRKYPSGTLPAYVADYSKVFTKRQAKLLGQLAYAQKAIRKRLEALEAMALAQLLGMVEIEGNMHEMFCAKREHPTNECNCDLASAGKENEG